MITQRAWCFVAWAALAACGGGGNKAATTTTSAAGTGGAAADGIPCAQAIDHLFSVTVADEEPALRAISAKVFNHRCGADRWSVELRQCLAEVKQPADADVCEQMLSREQSLELRHELARELEAAGVKPETQGGRPPPQAPPPANAK